MVELKTGETINGTMVACDSFMNLTLSDVIRTSPDGDRFEKTPKIYLRGTLIKFIRVPDDLLERIREERQIKREELREQERRERRYEARA